MRVYAIQVDIYEAATAYAFPIVQHRFLGRDRDEAIRYHASHRRSDRFLRECEDHELFNYEVPCRPVVTEIGWIDIPKRSR